MLPQSTYFTKQRVIVGFIILLLTIYYTNLAKRHGVDFDVFLHAGYKLGLDQNIYQPPLYKGFQYYYSPLWALFLMPFSSFPYFITEFFWLLLSCCLIIRLWHLSKLYFTTSVLTAKNYTIWFWAVFFFSIRFILDNFTQAQMSIFLLWSTFEAFHLFTRKKIVTGAILLAFAINVKIMPVIFLPYLFYRKKWKEGLLVILFYLVLLYVPAIFIGWEYNNFLLAEWWKIINPGNTEHFLETTLGPHSLGALLSVLLTDTTGEMAIKRNVINLPVEQVILIINLARFILVGITLAFLGSLPFKKSKNSLHQFWEMSYLFLVTPILFPHILIYAFIYICPMILYCLYFFIVQRQQGKHINKFILCLFILCGLLSLR